jgi:hypothetical protein
MPPFYLGHAGTLLFENSLAIRKAASKFVNLDLS